MHYKRYIKNLMKKKGRAQGLFLINHGKNVEMCRIYVKNIRKSLKLNEKKKNWNFITYTTTTVA